MSTTAKVAAVTVGLVGLAVVAVNLDHGEEAGPPVAPLAPPPPPVQRPATGGRQALVLVHDEWREGVKFAAGLGRACPEGELARSELAALNRVLEGRGWRVTVANPEDFQGDVLQYSLVVAHDGGWGSHLPPTEARLLRDARASAIPTLFLGDDTGLRLARDPQLLDWAGIRSVSGNGGYPVAITVDGIAGFYEKEPDTVALRDGAYVHAWTAGRSPLAWVVAGGHVAVGLYSLRASDVCPVAPDPAVEEALARLTERLVDGATR